MERVGADLVERASTEQGERAVDISGQHIERSRNALTAAKGRIDQQRLEIVQKDKTIETQVTTIKQQDVKIEEQKVEISRLDTSIRLLKVDQRVARLRVLRQDTDPDTKEVETVIEFVELGEDDQPVDQPKKFTIRGDIVYIDNLIVKFDDEYVERADIERATSLVMFRRIFGEFQEPSMGFPLEEEGKAPRIYSRGKEPSELEQRIWSDFWAIANNPEKAEELGIRALHGEAVSIKTMPGKVYRVQLRASDGLSIVPDDAA